MLGLPTAQGLEVVVLSASTEPQVAELCRRCTEFFELIEGEPGGHQTAEELLGPRPEEVARGTKHVFGVEREGQLIGVAELMEGFPADREWYVGLLLLLPELRRQGLGTNIWAGLRDWMHAQGGTVVRLVVQKNNPAARVFWERQRFRVEREVVGRVGKSSTACWRMHLRISPEPARPHRDASV